MAAAAAGAAAGITTLTELVAWVAKAAEDRLYDTLAGSVTAGQARALDSVLEVEAGWRRSPARPE